LDGVNDPTLTFYNNIVASGEEIIPTSTFDASLLGLNGVMGMHMYCENGIYLEVACAGSVEVVPQFSPFPLGRRV
jgi:hypothetical protein